MIHIWQIYGAVTHFLVSSYTVKTIYLIICFSSFLENEVKLTDL